MDISTTQLHTQYFCSTAGAVSSMNMRLPRCIHANAKTLCTRGGVCPASPNCISNDAQDLGLRVGDKCVQQDVPQLHSHLNAIRAGTGSRILRTMCGQIRRKTFRGVARADALRNAQKQHVVVLGNKCPLRRLHSLHVHIHRCN